VGIAAHGPVQELDQAAEPFEFFEQEHLVDVVAGEAVGGGNEHAVDRRGSHRVAQRIQARPA
jgi:hypothetical protein